jgi:hypothetical protein
MRSGLEYDIVPRISDPWNQVCVFLDVLIVVEYRQYVVQRAQDLAPPQRHPRALRRASCCPDPPAYLNVGGVCETSMSWEKARARTGKELGRLIWQLKA